MLERASARVLLVVLLTAGALLASVGAAAAPVKAPNAFPITIVCPSGTYEAVVNGNGSFTAAHSTTTNQVLIPIAFGEFTATITDPQGNTTMVIQPPMAKGSSNPRNGAVEECVYYVNVTFPGGTFVGSGSVTGFVTPVR